jgi:hypothetical protein
MYHQIHNTGTKNSFAGVASVQQYIYLIFIFLNASDVNYCYF